MATKITLKQLGQDVLNLLNKSGDCALEKEITSNVTVGAAVSGTIFTKGQTFTEFAEKILRKDIIPSISASFSGSGVKEKGTTVNGSTMVVNIDNLNNVTVPINEIKFYDGSNLINTQPFVNGQSNYTYIYNTTIFNNKTLSVEVVYNTNSKVSKSGSFTFVYASYYGATSLSSIDDASASSLSTTFFKSIKTSKGLTWNNITLTDERFCYMYPTSLGQLSSIKDGNGFSQIDGYNISIVNLTTPINGDIVQYYVYLLKDATTGIGFTQIYA